MDADNGSLNGPSSSTSQPTTTPDPGHKLAQIIRPRLRRPPKAEYHAHLSPSHAQKTLPGIHQLGVFTPTAPAEAPVPRIPDDEIDERAESASEETEDGIRYQSSLAGDASAIEENSEMGVSPEELQDSNRPKKRRRRQALSCSECKRRKIKCDRIQPCGPCSRRGESMKCKWELLDPLDKPISRSQYDVVRTQLARTEHALAHANAMNAHLGLPPSLTFPPIPPPPMPHPSQVQGTNGSAHEPLPPIDHPPSRHIPPPPSLPLLPPPPPPPPPHIAMGRFPPPPYSHPAYSSTFPRSEWTHPGTHIPRPPGPAVRDGPRQGEEMGDAQSRTLLDGFMGSNASSGPEGEVDGADVYLSVPDKNTCDTLVDRFFSHVHWNICILHRPSFDSAYFAFWDFQARPDRAKRAKAEWMALLWAMLCLTVQSLSWRECVERRICSGLPAWRDLNVKCWTLAHAALREADFLNSTAIEVVQALVILCYCDMSPGHRRPNWGHLVATTARIAMNTGLHRLGTDEGHIVSSGTLKREIGRRVWWNIVYFDWYRSIDMKGTYFIHLAQFDTAEPANLGLEDMDEGKMLMSKNAAVRTGVSFLCAKIGLARTIREYTDQSNSSEDRDDIITLSERRLDEVVNSMPTCLARYDASIEARNPVAKWERLGFLLCVNSSAISVHRKTMLAELGRPDVRHSMDVCVKAARAILVTFDEGQAANFPGCMWWSYIMPCYTAGMILVMEAFYPSDGVSTFRDSHRPSLILPVIALLERVADVNELAATASTVLRTVMKDLDLRSGAREDSPSLGETEHDASNSTSRPLALPSFSSGRSATAETNALKSWLIASLGRLLLIGRAPTASTMPAEATREFWDSVLRLDFRTFERPPTCKSGGPSSEGENNANREPRTFYPTSANGQDTHHDTWVPH